MAIESGGTSQGMIWDSVSAIDGLSYVEIMSVLLYSI